MFRRNLSTFGVATLVFGVAAIASVMMLVVADTTESSEEETVSSSLDNGLGDHIEWHTLDDGLALAKEENKPLMLLIHKSWCGACKSLKPTFRKSEKIAELSKSFVMVNTMDDDEPSGDTYRPDGGYIPRLLFFDPQGELMADIINEEGNPQYKYYYYDDATIVQSMKKVAALYTASSSDNDIIDNEDDISDHSHVKNEL